MAFRVAQFNILGRKMAGNMWFHYARDFLPTSLTSGKTSANDWWAGGNFPRCLAWRPEDDGSDYRYYRFQVIMSEIKAMRADVLCLVELDCFPEFRDALHEGGYDAVFCQRPGKGDGCGIFWRRDMFSEAGPSQTLVYEIPANDRIALVQPLRHLTTQRTVAFASTHLHWDQEAGHQLAEVSELQRFLGTMGAGDGEAEKVPVIVCGDLNTVPGAVAYEAMNSCFADAALAGGATYERGSFTSLKPDVYYYAKPRGRQYDKYATDEWHFQAGRAEVLDYIFYDSTALEVESPPSLPCLDDNGRPEEEGSSKRVKRRTHHGGERTPVGFWSGGWAFHESPATDYEGNRYNPDWTPQRKHGLLQVGIPNRLHGSDHLPVVCTMRFRGGPPRRTKRKVASGRAT